MGVAVGDVDNDGWQDLYVTAFGSNVLYRNRGDGTFADVTARADVDDPRWTTSAAFIDYDRDGDHDLFLANYVAFTSPATRCAPIMLGARDYCPPGAYAPRARATVQERRRLAFTDVTESSGVARAYGAGLGVAVGDLDGDGWPDIYVANDATPNQLWINRHDGTFEDRGLLSGTAFNALGRPEGSMGIALGDADNDGDEDLFVTNIVGETHVLYLNDGRGNFEDARAAPGWAVADGRDDRLRHRLDRLRQRRPAGLFVDKRRRQHHRGAARSARALPPAQSAVPQRGRGRFRDVSAAGRARVQAPRRRARRGLRRHRQRWRRGRGGHQQQTVRRWCC